MAIDKKQVLLSILIISIPTRLDKLAKLYTKLQQQIGSEPVEILTIVDNKAMGLGEKRNMALSLARGKYLAFLDDDDDISDDYISSILPVIRNSCPDVVCFRQHCTVNGKTFEVDFDLKNPIEQMSQDSKGNLNNIKRPPWHMCIWKSVLAKHTPFPEISWGEDSAWITLLCQRSKVQHKLNKILHYYQYSDASSETVQYRGS